jgi:hypothetical protein
MWGQSSARTNQITSTSSLCVGTHAPLDRNRAGADSVAELLSVQSGRHRCMMPTDLASMTPAGRDMTAPEADFASVVEPTWYERSARPNHCTLPGAETSAHAAMEGSTAHATVKSRRAGGRDAEHCYRSQRNQCFAYHVLLLRLQCLDVFADPSLDWIRLSSRWTNRSRPQIKSRGLVFVLRRTTISNYK